MSCAYCGSTDKLGVEHVVPRSRGGLDAPENKVQACRRCNSSKGDKLPSEWRDGLSENIYEIERLALSIHKTLKPRMMRGKTVKKDTSINVRMTTQQRMVLEAMSEREGLGLSTWLLNKGLLLAAQEQQR